MTYVMTTGGTLDHAQFLKRSTDLAAKDGEDAV
jgi:hypothetical protein